MKDQVQYTEDPIVKKQMDFLGEFIDGLTHVAYIVDVASYRITGTNAIARTIGFKEGSLCYQRHGKNKPCDKSTGRNCPIPMLQKGEAVDAVHLGEHTHKDGFKRVSTENFY